MGLYYHSTAATGSQMLTTTRIDTVSPQVKTDVATEDTTEEISKAYNGSKLFMRLLRYAYWGPEMLNLGYYPWYLGPYNIIRPISGAQRSLAFKLIQLLNVQRTDDVVDIACGRGGTTYYLSTVTPAKSVVGVDLLPENIEIAKRIYPTDERFTYKTGNAQDLPFPDASFRKAMCCEAAFHFPERARFVAEVARVLKPGGRLAICDFLWKSRACREEGLNDHRGHMVRQIWEYEDMATEAEYQHWATEAGLKVTKVQNWSKRVTKTLQLRGRIVTSSTKTAIGKRIVNWLMPAYTTVTDAEWDQLRSEVAAHQFITDRTNYKALVFEKPA